MLLVAFLMLMLPTSNCKCQPKVPGKSIWHIWKIKGNRRQSRLDGKGNLSVMKLSS